MKLLVIVLCLLSERYLVHAVSHSRFSWFNDYFNAFHKRLPQTGLLANSYVVLLVMILPLFLISLLVLTLFCQVLFGFIYLLLNIAVFYYCLGPANSFYPVGENEDEKGSDAAAEHYFIAVNDQLFAVVFWYIVLGPLAIITYRLISLCRQQLSTADAARQLKGILDWITSRLTVLLYLLVGNFQQGFSFFSQQFLSPPGNNDQLLAKGGVLAARTRENEVVTLPNAQSLVEHAIIVYLVFLALFTLGALL